MPSGENSFYVDQLVPNNNFGAYIGRELVEMSRRMFPLSHRREDTFLAGFSMGGFGAIRNGLKYYDTFGYIAVLSGALQVFEAPPDSPNWSLFGARSVFGGPDRDRSDDLTDAKKTYKPFYTISNYLRCFPLSFSFFPPLFRPLISMCCTTVFGASCGQKRSPALAGVFRRQGRGAFFMPLAVWIVPLKAGLGKSFLCRPCLRNWGGSKQSKNYPQKQYKNR